MEKGYGKYQGHFWLIVFLASVFWFLLFYFPLSDFRCSKKDQTKKYLSDNLVISPEQGSIITPPVESPNLLAKSPKSSVRSTDSAVKSKSSVKSPNSTAKYLKTKGKITIDRCKGRYIYVHDLPSRFNRDLLKKCQSISLWTDMCKFTSNAGLGPRMKRSKAVFSDTGWFATNQFTLEVIFHNRMKQYDCLTKNSSMAAAIFVPFYAGLDISRYLWGFNISMRDSASLGLIDWLVKRPEWKVMGGKDHFLVAGRITWDFRRHGVSESDWGNKLFLLPEAKKMSMLVIESSPWHSNDFAIPYPSYFHPTKDRDVFNWRNRVRKMKRPWLFAFVGAPRPNSSISIRGQIIDQCRASKFGFLLDCSSKDRCDSPISIMRMFESSVFCLQPQGDSFTRRSAFDSMLAGCIPVFFHPGSAYIQYTWHLPRNYSKYSVFITEDDVRKGVSIEKILLRIPKERVRIMREEVIRLIPRIIYADPRSRLETVKDAFDISVQAVIDKIDRTRRMMKQGILDEGFGEENSWKYALLGNREKVLEEHEWDHFFSEPLVQKIGNPELYLNKF